MTDIEIWIDEVSSVEQEIDEFNPASIPFLQQLSGNAITQRTQRHKRSFSIAMDDTEITPRPSKKRHREIAAPVPPEIFSTHSQSSAASSELDSHKSGRMSPTKQLALLEDLDHPIKIRDFEREEAELPQEVEELRAPVQFLADGHGILGYTNDELAALQNSQDPQYRLNSRTITRFQYDSANDFPKRLETGVMPSLSSVLDLVRNAVRYESDREHEFNWNEVVHYTLIKLALTTSSHASTLAVKGLKTATIDPPFLAEAKLPRRVIDYAIVLEPDDEMNKAFGRLKPLSASTIKSWNHTTTINVRRTPIAINIETKAPDKSWTDGKAQLAIWTNAFFKRLQLLADQLLADKDKRKEASLDIPAMPLVIAQGHDWYLLIISHQQTPGQEQTILWQKLDIGSTRNCFDALKVIAVLHFLMRWAEKTWRPWFRKSFLGEGDNTLARAADTS